ncbi:MAG: hypothetical protein MJ220_01970 [Bacilli bacterium]|nr:hypothetical protein [Bacilli bacterium]
MRDYIVDTNIVVDLETAVLLDFLNINCFHVSNLVYIEEISKQSSWKPRDFQILKETPEDIMYAYDLHERKKKISVYDAINISLAKRNEYILLTGDQQLIKQATSENVECHGIIWLLKILFERYGVSKDEIIKGLEELISSPNRRIPKDIALSLKKELGSK